MDAIAPDQSYQRIKNAAIELFATKGYTATGIRDIARAADISSATLYHHVANKEELLVAIMNEAFETLIGVARAALAGLRTPEAKLAALVRQHVIMEATQRTLATVATVEYRFLTPEARSQVLPTLDAYGDIWRAVIDDGIRSGAFDVPDARLARLALLEMCDAPSWWYREDGPSSVEEIADAFADMALALVRARRRPGKSSRRRS